MNARTCLLCGKSLSRIWVGAGQDFCSREHRNQYRLRRGMDRLQEANKVANLMRRRENPKAIPCLRQAGNTTARMADSSRIRLYGSSQAALPATKWSPAVEIPDSRSWVDPNPKFIPDAKARAFGMSWRQPTRAYLKMESRQIESPGEQYLERVRQPSSLPPTLHKGRLLRVSEGAGFRLPAMRSKELSIPAATPALRGMDGPRVQALPSFDWPSDYQVPTVVFDLPEMCAPAFSVPVQRNVIGARGPLCYPGKAAAGDDGAVVRSTGEVWPVWDAAMPRPIRHAGLRMQAPGFVGLRHRARGGQAAQHMVLMPLLPEDRAFAYIPAIASSPLRPSGVPRSNLEEHFDGGLRNWSGGVGDWLIDAAGVRPGSLALFIPTLEQRDYDLEFLAHIENHSVTFVFRASSLNDHHRATISIAPDGSCEFAHGTVVRGTEELVPAVSVGVAIRKKKAFTVRLRATGSQFTLWLDGQSVDSWTDNRFPKGGIGFSGAPDDRARIYWVRLSSTGSLGKEFPKR